MVTKVIAAINDNWPDRNRNMFIQQDGAPAHIRENDAEVVPAETRGLWKHQAQIATTKVARCQRAWCISILKGLTGSAVARRAC